MISPCYNQTYSHMLLFYFHWRWLYPLVLSNYSTCLTNTNYINYMKRHIISYYIYILPTKSSGHNNGLNAFRLNI
jgi:hypothetical protein